MDSMRFPRPLRRPVLALLCAALSACGGGVWIGIGDGIDDGGVPSVSLAVSPSVAAPGQFVRLAAAATDTHGIEQVLFYRVDNGAPVLLFADNQYPYEIDTATPQDGRAGVQYFAQAVNHRGRRSDSAWQTVTLRRP
ncbi:hypothetical protein [Caldimonas tepidiphila]|uniref:hypothetical protein n=1 Tax=Caldimonas tepidiphila TaxID=2315841 RepID=UPI000E5AF7D2|nr:hypothetical protein [Caldimonas tepidiphila]